MDPHQVQEEFSSFLESPSFLESVSSTRTASMTRSSSTKASVLTMTPAQFKARVLNTKTWRGREKGRKPRLAKAKAKTPAKSKKTSTGTSKTANKKTTAPTVGSGRSAGLSGKTGGKSGKTSGQSGRTSGKSGKTSGQSGGTSGKSGKTSGQSGRTSGKSGKTSGQSGGASGKSGKTSGESGRGSGKSGKTSGTSGRDGGKSGKTSGTSGKDGGKSGKTSGTSGKNGGKSGKTSGTGGKDSGKSGKTSGNGSKKKTSSNDPARVALPPSQKQKKASAAAIAAAEKKKIDESGEWVMKMGRIAANQTTASVAGKRGRELAIASMLAAGVSQADIDKVLQTLLGMTIRNGAVGFASGVSEQLGSCASCWAYTAADALQRIHLRLGGALSRVALSSQQLIDCVKSVDTKGCMGGSPLDALDYWQKNPAALLSEYPSKPTAGKCKPYASITQRPPVYASYGWDMLIPACDDMTGDCKKQVQYEHLLVDWVKLGGTAPIVYIDATNMQNHKGSIFDISKCQSTMEAGNHVVQIIGFSTDPETGAPFWMLQNSWGPDWGEYGRMRVPFGLNACGLANFVIIATDPAMSHQSGAGSSTTAQQTLQNLRASTQELASASPLKANLGSPTPSLTPAGSQSFTSQVNANRAAAAAAGQPAPAPSTVQRGASFDDPFLQAILDGKLPASGTIVQGAIQSTPK